MTTSKDRNTDLDRQPVSRKWRNMARRRFLWRQNWRTFRLVMCNQFKVAVQILCSVFRAFSKCQTYTSTLELGWFLVRKEQSTRRERTVILHWKMQSMCQEFSKSQDVGSRIDEGNMSFFLGNRGVMRGFS